MIICMQCGFQNEKETKNCENCGAQLPRVDTSAMIKVEKVAGRAGQFQNAVEQVKSGEWGTEEFFEFLQNIYQVLAEKRASAEQLIAETNYHEMAEEEVQQGLEGMDQFEEGMQEMSLYVEDGEISHLDIGLELIFSGNEKINDAMMINRAERRKLEEEWGWM